jgi:tricorn protease
VLCAVAAVTLAGAPAQATPAGPETMPAHLMRYADIHAGTIVFTYEDDLWTVPAAGGDARRLTVHPGIEYRAKFSPDGRWIAFTGEYDGNGDVFVMDARGGAPRRLTFHPAFDQVLGWHPDGRHVLFRTARTHPHGSLEIWSVSVDGGLPEKLPIDRGGLAAYSPDGRRLAYNRIPRENRTWKRYQGGMAQEIWIADLASGAIAKKTDWPGSDNYPMWEAEGLYFTSDREDGTLNIYRLDPETGSVARLTDYADYDVKEPSSGPGQIVFRYAEQLHVLDLADGTVADVEIRIPTDRIHVRPELVEIAPRTGSFGLSPAGERLLLEARGEIFTLPAEEGEPINLTATSGSREKNAAWSPDGRQVCFVSDRTGEEELYLVDKRGGEWRQLTNQGGGLLLQPVWSPDGKHILFGDKFMRLNLVDVASGKTRVIDQGEFDDAWERWGILDYVWSPDSRWVAYTKNGENMNESIYLYNLDSGGITRVTDAMTTDWSPSFDPEGRYLWFLSNRTFEPIMGRTDQTHVFLRMARPYLVLLQAELRSPFLPKEDEVAVADDKKDKDETNEKKDGGDGEAARTVIDLDGIAERVLAAAEVPAHNYFRLEATPEGCLLLRKNEPEFLKYQNVDDRTTGKLDLLAYKLDDQEVEELMSGIANYHLSADGKKVAYRAGDTYGIVDTGKKAESSDGRVDLSDAKIRLDRSEEFAQIFREAWRIERDWFYDPGMHGVDWDRIYDKYAAFVPECGTRGDVNYLIGEMIAELNIGHTYVWGGDASGGAESVSVGLLGCDFARDRDAAYYRIARIVPGISWDPHLRSPLGEPGVGVAEGDYLIAIDGEEIPTTDNVFAHLQDKAGRVVELTVNDRPRRDGARTVRVETLGSEYALRYMAWVEANRRKVDAATDGRIGYLHLPNMGEQGLAMFARYFYPQALKQAFIIDERDNGGGFVGDMIIDRLERRLWAVTQPREGGVARDPERCFHGPLVVLIDEWTGSNGEYFAEAIKRKSLATLIGMRTWGGAVGIEPHQDLVDGGTVTPPQFGIYGLDGAWIIEGRGVEPDIEVLNDPADVVAGRDPQLQAAIEHLEERLARDGDQWRIPAPPPFPDKSKPGEGVGR